MAERIPEVKKKGQHSKYCIHLYTHCAGDFCIFYYKILTYYTFKRQPIFCLILFKLTKTHNTIVNSREGRMCSCPGQIWVAHQAEEVSHLMYYKQHLWRIGCLLQRTEKKD